MAPPRTVGHVNGEPSPGDGSRPLGRQGRGAEAFVVSPFTRLARVHLMSAAGDALIGIALAGSLFFNLDPTAARSKVALYLLLTIAPFAVVGPLIGPLIDRAPGGRRGIVILSAAGRALLAVMMIRHLDSLLIFPEAFGALVLGKTYHVSKSALVPRLVRDNDGLVEANSKLTLLSGLGGALAAGPGLLLNLLGSEWVLAMATAVFVWMAAVGFRIPSTQVASLRPPRAERAASRSAGIVLAASAMSVLRGLTGFTLFLLAFWLRSSEASAIWFGVMIAASAAGQLSGAVMAPHLRRLVREEYLLGGVLIVASITTLVVAFPAQRGWVILAAMSVGLAAGLGKLSFDAIVQRDAPEARQGETFARFETRFQLMWVLGGIVPVITPNGILSIRAGLVMMCVASGSAAFLYLGGLAAVQRGRRTPGEVIAARLWTEQRRAAVRAKLPRWLQGRRLPGAGGEPPGSGAR